MGTAAISVTAEGQGYTALADCTQDGPGPQWHATQSFVLFKTELMMAGILHLISHIAVDLR